VQTFQDNALGSGLGALRARITCTAIPPYADKPAALLHGALVTARGALSDSKKDLRVIQMVVCELRAAMADARREAMRAISGQEIVDTADNESSSHAVMSMVRAALGRAGRTVRASLDALVWWRMLGRSDEVGYILESAVRSAWSQEVERAVRPTHAPTSPRLTAHFYAIRLLPP